LDQNLTQYIFIIGFQASSRLKKTRIEAISPHLTYGFIWIKWTCTNQCHWFNVLEFDICDALKSSSFVTHDQSNVSNFADWREKIFDISSSTSSEKKNRIYCCYYNITFLKLMYHFFIFGGGFPNYKEWNILKFIIWSGSRVV